MIFPKRTLAAVWLLLLVAPCFYRPLCAQSHTNVPRDFDFLLVTTAAGPEMDMWHHTLRGTAIVLPALTHVYKEQPFSLAIVFQGYGVNEKSEAEVSYGFTITGPEGQVILKDTGLTGIDAKNVEPKALIMARQQVDLMFEPEDVFGEYTIAVTARDAVSGKVRKRQVRVQLVPFGYASSVESMEEYRRWLPTYYLQPDPVKAFKAYLDYADLDNAVTGQLDFSQIFFYKLLFEKHPFLLKALVDSYADADLQTRMKVLFMLALLDYREAPYLKELPEMEKGYFENVRLLYLPEPYEDLISPQQLDCLWAEFYATGRFEPIRQIVEGLALAEYDGSLEELGKGEESEKTDQERMNAYREVLLQSARWSLLSNCRQHPLVRAYCGFIFQEGPLTAITREELGRVLATADSTPSRVGLRRGIPEQAIPNPFRTPSRTQPRQTE